MEQDESKTEENEEKQNSEFKELGVIDTTQTERTIKLKKTNLRLVGAIITLTVIIFVLLGFNFFLYLQPKRTIGYVVEINQLTGTQNVRNIEGAMFELDNYTIPEYLMINTVKTYITNLRSVSTDPYQNRENMKNVYAYSIENAISQASDYFKENNPIERSQLNGERVVIYIYNSTPSDIVAKKGKAKFQIDWKETTYSSSGEIKKEQWYRAIVDFEQRKATKQSSQVNPLGHYISNFFISEIKDGFVQK